jgi:hypothetical protein
MPRIIWNSFWLAPALLGATAFSAFAQTSAVQPAAQDSVMNQVSAYSAEGQSAASLGQVTSVSQLTDVRPTDWAFQALQSLVERYGCIVGYPDRTFRGNRATSRFEFAAGLNACLDKIQELIAAATADFVKKEDLEVVKRLQEEFATELAALRGRVEGLEVRTATLEKQQFSTTTKLRGEVIFAIADTFGDRATIAGNGTSRGPFVTGVTAANRQSLQDDQTETIFGSRVRIALDSSFSGKDRLRVRLQGRNITPFAGAFTGTNETRLAFDGNESNAVNIDHLYYRFPVGKNLRFQIDAVQSRIYDSLVETLSPFESSGSGAISRFGRFNPIYRSNNQGLISSPGASLEYKFGNAISFQAGYFSDQNANDPGQKNGLFDGSFAAVGQIVIRPSRKLDVGLTYVRSYNPGASPAALFNQGAPNLFGSTGTGYAANPFGGEATATDTLSAQLQWRVAPKITVGGWYAYSFASNKLTGEEARISNYAGFLGFPDLGGKGNLGGLLLGMQPRVLNNDFRARTIIGGVSVPNPNVARRLDRDPPFHAEAFYRYRVSDNIAITPGVIVLFNAEGNRRNETQYVGVVRTTFSF